MEIHALLKSFRVIAVAGVSAVLIFAGVDDAWAANSNSSNPAAGTAWWTPTASVKLSNLPIGTRIVNCWGRIKKLPPGVRIETGPGFSKTHPGFHFLIDGRCALDPNGISKRMTSDGANGGLRAGMFTKEFDLQWFGTGLNGGPKVGASSCFAAGPLKNHCGVPTNMSSRQVPQITTTETQLHAVPFDLYTHCGINELSVNGKYFQHVGGPLSGGSGNPPTGWGNPYQHGTLSVSGDVAVFRDTAGHVETFKARPGATGFLKICN